MKWLTPPFLRFGDDGLPVGRTLAVVLCLFAQAGAYGQNPPPEGSSETLLELRSPDPRVVNSALADLLRRDPKEGALSAKLLPALVRRQETDVSTNAVHLLAHLRSYAKPAFPGLIQLLRTAMPAVRGSVAGIFGALGPDAATVVPTLQPLMSTAEAPPTREAASDSLALMGTTAAPASRTIATSLRRDPDAKVRRNCAKALGNLIPGAPLLAPTFFSGLKDGDQTVREQIVESIRANRAIASGSLESLVESLRTGDSDCRDKVVSIFEILGADGAPALSDVLDCLTSGHDELEESSSRVVGIIGDKDPTITQQLIDRLKGRPASTQGHVIEAIGMLGPQCNSAQSRLRGFLDPQAPALCFQAEGALGKIGDLSDPTISDLEGLLATPNEELRRASIVALGEQTQSAVKMLPVLIKHLNRSDPTYPSLRAVVGRFSVRALDDAKNLNGQDKGRLLIDLTDGISRLGPEGSRDQAGLSSEGHQNETVRSQLKALQAVLQHGEGEPVERLGGWVGRLPLPFQILLVTFGAPVVLCLGGNVIFFALALLRPLSYHSLTEKLVSPERKDDHEAIKKGLGDVLYAVLGVNRYRFLPRVTDAWVDRYRESAWLRFEEHSGYSTNSFYVPPSVEVNGDAGTYGPHLVDDTVQRRSWVIEIVGVGGTGKTTASYRLVMWILGKAAAPKLALPHPMLPILLSKRCPDEWFGEPARLLSAISGEVKAIIAQESPPSPEFVAKLLKSRRLVVVVDGVSERPSKGQDTICTAPSDLNVNALVVTSRSSSKFQATRVLTVHSVRLSEEGALNFFREAIKAQGKEPQEEHERHLSTMARGRWLTTFIVNEYANYAVRAKNVASSDENLPRSVSEVVDLYVVEMLTKASVSRFAPEEMLEVVRKVAWLCVRPRLISGEVKRTVLIKGLEDASDGIHPLKDADSGDLLKYLTGEAQILMSSSIDRQEIKFAVDTVGEYQAASYLLEHIGEGDRQFWLDLIKRLRKRFKDEPGTAGFVLALMDSISARNAAVDDLGGWLLPQLEELLDGV